jgi:hypothetical protein
VIAQHVNVFTILKDLGTRGKRYKRYVEVECDLCGKIQERRYDSLQRVKSCGCQYTPHINSIEVGKKYRNLLVLEKLGTINGRYRVKVRCDCGKEKTIRIETMKSSKSCGCAHSIVWAKHPKKMMENLKKGIDLIKLPLGESAFNSLLFDYKRGAQDRGYSFELTKEEFRELTKGTCYYCDSPPNNTKKGIYNNGPYIYSGIDRIDNTKGYSIDNCVSCCSICNYMKRDLSQNDFKKHITKMYNTLIKEK